MAGRVNKVATEFDINQIDGPAGSSQIKVLRIGDSGAIVGQYNTGKFSVPMFENTPTGGMTLVSRQIISGSITYQPALVTTNGSTSSGSYFNSVTGALGSYLTENGHTTLMPLNNAGMSTSVLALSDSGEAMIEHFGPSGITSYTIQSPAGKTVGTVTLPLGGSLPAIPIGVSDNGTVAGDLYSATNEGWYETVGAKPQTFTIPGARLVNVLGVNSAGLIVGDFYDNANTSHGFVFNSKTGEIDQIDAPGKVNTVISAINNNGEIAGTFDDTPGVSHAFVAQTGTPPNLGTNDGSIVPTVLVAGKGSTTYKESSSPGSITLTTSNGTAVVLGGTSSIIPPGHSPTSVPGIDPNSWLDVWSGTPGTTMAFQVTGTAELSINGDAEGMRALTGGADGNEASISDPSITVNLATHSDLIWKMGDLDLGSLIVNGTGTLTGGGYLFGTQVIINSQNTGGFFLTSSYTDPAGHADVANAMVRLNGATSGFFTLAGSGTAVTAHGGLGAPELLVSDVKDFTGIVTFGGYLGPIIGNTDHGILGLLGVSATSYDIKADIAHAGGFVLDLYGAKGALLKSVDVQSYLYNTKPVLTVEHNSQGTFVAAPGDDKFQLGGIGVALHQNS